MKTPDSSGSPTPISAPRSTIARGAGGFTRIAIAFAVYASMALLAGCKTTTETLPRGTGKSKSATISGDRSVEYVQPVVVQTERPASSGRKSAPSLARRSEDPLDDCAERLHSLCGPLLFYFMQNHHLPATLQDLPASPEPVPPLMCPESHKPYVYALKTAIPIDNPKGYIIVHDPVPAHDGVRWCIVASSGNSATEPLIVKSVGIREDRFAVLRSKALTEQKEMEHEQQKEQAAPTSKK